MDADMRGHVPPPSRRRPSAAPTHGGHVLARPQRPGERCRPTA